MNHPNYKTEDHPQDAIILTAGTGYWDLSRFPWGGDFKRIQENVALKIVRIIDRYNDGSPRRVVLNYYGKEIGVTL
jgi:hypothetical protein